jgi:predicted glycogen debranching enzyme
MIDFGREVCGDLAQSARREWLVTNGLGGYASGTVAGLPTRRYHALLIAALRPPLGRTLLLTKLDETAAYNDRLYPLFTNRWANGLVEPTGFRHVERFHLEGTTPVWTFACADALLEKRVWMQSGANTTYVRYTLRRASAPLTLTIKTLVNYRDHHASTRADSWQMQVALMPHGLRIIAFDGATPFYLLSDTGQVSPQHDWYRDYFLEAEDYRGLDARDDHLYAGEFRTILHLGQSLTLVASTEEKPNLDSASAYADRQAYERQILAMAGLSRNEGADTASPHAVPLNGTPIPATIKHLILAADQFIVHRPLPNQVEGRTVIAGYPWFGDWGRDTMISLPGLTLITGRYEVAASILHTFAHFVDRGMLPNRFPDEDQSPEYNTVDATLWYFEAVRAYHAASGDEVLLNDLFPVLQEIVEQHRRGTRYQIHIDPTDGLLYAGDPGVQLTWMDAKVGDWVVTPRAGKAVEVNALWYNALRIMSDFARRLGQEPDYYDTLADQAQRGFARFWNQQTGHCYDVLDGPEGEDLSLRPNQLLAVSLPYSPLTSQQQRAVVDVCARHLLTSYGLRSLAPGDPAYIGHYGGDQRQRDGAYHQGTAWSWLIGPFVSAHLRVYKNFQLTRSCLLPLLHQLADHGLGTISEIFDGDPPFTPRGCVAQAWGVAELLRVWQETRDLEQF